MPKCIHVQSMYVLIMNVYTYMHKDTLMYAHVGTHVCAHTHMYTETAHLCTHAGAHSHVCAYANTFVHVLIHAHMHRDMLVCAHMQEHVPTCAHMHSHTLTHASYTHTHMQGVHQKEMGRDIGTMSGLPCDEEGAAIGAPSAIILVVWGVVPGLSPPRDLGNHVRL